MNRITTALLLSVAGLIGGASVASAQDIKIRKGRELAITDLSVVEDPARTNPAAGGKWTFKHLVTQMAGTRDPSQFVMRWLKTWETDRTVNTFAVAKRPSIRQLVIDPWLQKSGGTKLDLNHAPFRLLAIVNRIDLRVESGGVVKNAGEGRFVFGVLDGGGNQLPFTVIFEYGLPATNATQLKSWAESWHRLGSVPFGARYNRLLDAVTRRFTRAGANASKPNGSALNQIRTNEIALAGPWELREFRIRKTGWLLPARVRQTPDASFNDTVTLRNLVNQNTQALLAGTFSLPRRFEGGSAPVSGTWNAAGINNLDARHALAVNTCNGCHSNETGTPFLHVGTRNAGQASTLSGFMTGITVTDPVSGKQRTFNDLRRRAIDLRKLLRRFLPTTGSTGSTSPGSTGA